jgi:hypothetical protein
VAEEGDPTLDAAVVDRRQYDVLTFQSREEGTGRNC